MAEPHDARPDAAPRAQPTSSHAEDGCPYLGLRDDERSRFSFPSSEHRCHAGAKPAYVELAHQGAYCLTAEHVTCARYPAAEPAAPPAAEPTVPPAAEPVVLPGPTPSLEAAAATPEPTPSPAAQPPAPPEPTPEPPTPEPPTAPPADDMADPRPGMVLSPRGGFGSLAATPRGWVPVETAAVAAAPGGVPESPAQAMSDGDRTDPERAPDDSLWSVAEQEAADEALRAPASEASQTPEAEIDTEGIGALVAGGAMVAGPAVGERAPDVDGGEPFDEDAPLASAGASEAAAGPDEEPAAPIPGGPAALPPGIGARIAGFARHVLRLIAIAVAGILILAALVGVGYVAGKLLVRPGETAATPAPSVVPSPPAASPLAPGETSPPGSGGAPATAGPSGPSTSTAPAESAAPTARPNPKPTPTAVPAAKPRVYVVKSGDTLSAIAARFGVPLLVIARANKLTAPYVIYTGQRLVIPRS